LLNRLRNTLLNEMAPEVFGFGDLLHAMAASGRWSEKLESADDGPAGLAREAKAF
jgi:hypothetical protein